MTLAARRTLLPLALLASLIPFYAASASAAGMAHDAHADHASSSAAAPMSAAPVDGVVKKVDRNAGKVTVAHGPLVNLNMPAMTMAFRVKEAGWLDRLKVDDKIRFVAESIDGTLTIVRLEDAK